MIGGGGIRALMQSGGGKALYAGKRLLHLHLPFPSPPSSNPHPLLTHPPPFSPGLPPPSAHAGVFQNLLGVAPASAIFISVYEPVKKWVEARVDPERNYLGPMAAGAAAGVASSFVRVPTEVIKSRLQTGEVKGAIAAVSLAREGAEAAELSCPMLEA
jgi:hypothetical protein